MGQINQNSKLESQGSKQGATPGRQEQDLDMSQKKQAEERARKQSEEKKNKQSPKRDSHSDDSEQV